MLMHKFKAFETPTFLLHSKCFTETFLHIRCILFKFSESFFTIFVAVVVGKRGALYVADKDKFCFIFYNT